ncbi:Alpha/Beta hydrolase protein [Apodospora peruviana]|uniref:Alpha/Beta hydrolase protein n=1 Tax=Apodospora peruviana TaxID=516989 RepID=A0AAE0HW42_9PEZI|nr:Alpha/Beta hydrolase protein [Apodospora peruviana]
MASQQIASYGTWESPITVQSVTSKAKSLSSPRVSSRSGRVFFGETKDSGNNCIVEITSDGIIKDILPAEYSAGNTVYEYGGSAYDVLSDGHCIIFSHSKGNTVHVLNTDTCVASDLVVDKPHLRYASFFANPAQDSRWVVAVEEDHEHDTPDQVKDYIVVINADSGEVRRIGTGADFYYTPQFSPDGKRVVWLEWDHPDLPFGSAKLVGGDWDDGKGKFSGKRVIAGEGKQEGVAEPRFGPDGSLFFGQEINGYRQLFRILPGETEAKQIELPGLEKAELGEIRWLQGSQTYAPLSSRYVIAAPTITGASQLILIDLENNSWREIADSTIFAEAAIDAIARLTDSSALVIGSGTTTPQNLYKFTFSQHNEVSCETIRESTAGFDSDQSIFSKPEVVSVPCVGQPSRTVHGILWMPHNPAYRAPDGDLPPLIVQVHGGPTHHTGPGLKLRTQYFTSRGFAYFALNYTGSDGHGQAYRDALFGHWGILDADDAAECVKYLVAQNRVKAGAAGITGPSAGGYNVLQSMIRHGPETFASGVCVCGVSDVKKLGEATHKLEAKYLEPLVLGWDFESVSEEEKEKVYRERSPVYHASDIRAPLLLLHGVKDTVVPIEQARAIAEAIREKEGDVRIVEVEGEGHMFGAPVSKKIWLEEEEKWWHRTLL